VDVRLDDVTAGTFDALAAGCASLIDELVESARTFFDNPHGCAPDRKST
jgi:hypothetical protein